MADPKTLFGGMFFNLLLHPSAIEIRVEGGCDERIKKDAHAVSRNQGSVSFRDSL